MIRDRLKNLARPTYHRIGKVSFLRDRAYRMVIGSRFRDWCNANPCRTFGDREQLYEHLLDEHALSGPIDYLEFGVWEGASMRWWIERNTHPDSSFVGFDSFEGLPTNWEGMPPGSFSTQGAVPDIADPRCRFIKGYFHETLPPWLAEHHSTARLVIHLDADLYGSTLFTMLHLMPRLNPGDILIFDEFCSYMHEYRAFEDAITAFPMQFRSLGNANDWLKLALEVVR